MPKKRTRPLPFDAKAVGKRLSLARTRSEMSTHELAEASGVDQGKISRTERGKAVHNLADLVEICRATNHRLEWILFDKEPWREQSSDEAPASSTTPMDFDLDRPDNTGKLETKIANASAGAGKVRHGRRD